MARYGAKGIQWAPFATESAEKEGVLPKYGAALPLSELQKVVDAPTFAEGKQRGDDGLTEYVNEFVEAAVDVEITDLPVELEQAVLGATVKQETAGDITRFGVNTSAPYGALGFISCVQRKNVKKYQGIFYPKLKASMQGEEYTTKGDSITLAGGKLKFVAMACNSSDWKLKSKYLESESAVKTWLKALFEGTVTLAEAGAAAE